MIPQIPFPPVSEPSDVPISKESLLGNEVYSSLIFKGVDQVIENPNIPVDEQARIVNDFEIIDVILSVSKDKNIVKTPVQGRPGTVKEYISDGDYRVAARGVLVTPYRETTPKEEALTLEAFCSLGQTLEVASNYLEIFDVFTVVVDDFGVSQIPGTLNMYEFRIMMTQDTPIELTIEDPEL